MLLAKPYYIEKSDKIIIYGAATTGAIFLKKIEQLQLDVIAFIDKRADEIDTYYNKPVISIEESKRHANNNTIVIIAIKNVFEHEKIAKKLWGYGYTKIIFRPYSVIVSHGKRSELEINEAYDLLFKSVLPQKIPRVVGMEKNQLIDHAIIKKEGEYVWANIPIEYVFTDNYENKSIVWGDIPCLGLIPHIGLFRLFLGEGNDDYIEYMKFCREAAIRSGGIKISPAWEQSVYLNRLDVFNHMEYEWEHDRSFFVENTIEAIYNSQGYFNISSGKHRMVYLIAKGCKYVPLKIKAKEYALWSGEKDAHDIYQYLYDNELDVLPIVLPNPYFYDFPCSSSAFYLNVLHMLITNIFKSEYYLNGEFDFAGKQILICNSPMAMYSNYLQMLGFKVSILEKNSANAECYRTLLGEGEYEFLNQNSSCVAYYLCIIEDDEMQDTRACEKVLRITDSCMQKNDNVANVVCGYTSSGFKAAYIEKKE